MLLAAFALICGQLTAQNNRTVTGKVTGDKGVPLVGATVSVKGSSVKTLTINDGSFRIQAPNNAKSLEVSYVGYATQEINITGKNSVDVSLVVNDASLTEVVITGYTREKKSQFVGSATTLSSKVVETVPVGAFDQALQGRAPGMQVSSASGQPGTSALITIRGIQTLTNSLSSPLFIVDGVPLPAGDMATINPNDFESITVLKDASAAALYGARGGLGVIVITTKRGKTGTNVTYRNQFGVTEPPSWNKFDMMNTQEILSYEERLGMQGYTTNTPGWIYSKNNPTYAGLAATSPAGNPYAASKARYDFIRDSIGAINIFYPEILFRKGFTQNHEINVSSGNERTRMFLSAGYFDQKGTDLTSRLARYTTRINLDHNADKVSIRWNTAAGYSVNTYSEGEFRGNSTLNSFQMAWRAKPYENPYNSNGTLNYGTSTSLALKQVANLLEAMQNTLSTQHQIKINSGLTLSYKVLPTVTLKNTLGIDLADDRWQRNIAANSFIGGQQANGGKGYDAEAYKLTTQIVNTSSAVFSKRFKDVHDVELGGYFEVIRGFQRGLGFQIWNLDPRLSLTGQGAGPLPVASATQQGSSAKSQYGIRSYFATARYTYQNKYTLNANVRRDGTSRILNPDNKEITTWSAGLIWNAMEESFMKKQGILTDLKMRVSYGSVPNIGSIGNGTAFGIPGGLIAVSNYLGAQVPSYGSTTYAGSPIGGQAPTNTGNPDLKIETIRKFNLGADFSVWQNRARFIVDVYKNVTKDLFVSNNIPATAGVGSGASLNINAGSMQNKGIELAASVDIVKKRDFDITLNANHAINRNKITSLGQVKEIPGGTGITRVGLPFGTHYAVHYLGADPATGKPLYEKEDGTSTTDFAQAFNFDKFGTYIPVHVGGFGAEVHIKRITISAHFSYQFDVKRYNNIENWVTRGITGYHSAVNASRRLLTQQWQKPGDVAWYQSPAYDRQFTSSDIEDASFLRFKNLTMAFNLPEVSLGSTKLIKSGRFYVQGQNLYIWSKWRGPDPEDNNNISLNEFPNPRAFVAGFDINF